MGDMGPIGMAGIGSANAIFDPRGRILLVKHTYGRFNWEIPGGIALPGEPPSVAARRELLEETRIDLPEGALSGVYFERDHPIGGSALHFVFRHVDQDDLVPAPVPPEIGDVGWFELDNLPGPMSDFTERRIRDALNEQVDYAVISARVWRE